MTGVRTSDLLSSIAAETALPRISIADLLRRFGDRTFGMLFLFLALCNFIPSVPGTSGVLGLALMLVAVQLVIGRPRPWMPDLVGRRSLSSESLRKGAAKVAPYLRRLERICRPRLAFATSTMAERLVGLLVMCLAVVISLPIPVVGNLPPAVAVLIMSLGLIERDGLLILVGLATGAVTLALMSAVTVAAIMTIIRGLTGA